MTNPPAFPGLHPSKECHYQDSGMTLRDYFAAAALQGMLCNGFMPDQVLHADGKPFRYDVAAYEFADAMLKTRENP